ncbi:MAG TPA: pyruvate kinase [Verrucomicrobia bacterium]|nr:pyruvate kinase [Verrucomicrobiota bacterium]
MRRTKIVCTIGPASEAPATLEKLIQSGMNVARLNFSHGTQEEHARKIEAIREISKRLGKSIAILQDLAGPKIRIGKLASGPIRLKPGDPFVITARDVPGDVHEVSLTYRDLPKDAQPGDTLMLADGALELRVEQIQNDDIHCRVVVGGELSSNKGINLPSRSISAPILTEKDRGDLAFGLRQGVDYVALSFVRTAHDIQIARDFMKQQGREVPLIAKIEKHEALKNIDEIVAAVDGIMVARGDLGVEIPLEQVPFFQKLIIEKANRAGKPVITATQMLKSMVDAPRPTRAEVTDVANAILEGTDAVMLSEESASGNYPVESVQTMAKIAVETEKNFPFEEWTHKFEDNDRDEQRAVAQAACELAENIQAAVLITLTQSGSTARFVAQHKPSAPILAPTPSQATYNRLALIWGCTAAHIASTDSIDLLIKQSMQAAAAVGLIKKGETAVITAGIPLQVSGITNLIKVQQMTDETL